MSLTDAHCDIPNLGDYLQKLVEKQIDSNAYFNEWVQTELVPNAVNMEHCTLLENKKFILKEFQLFLDRKSINTDQYTLMVKSAFCNLWTLNDEYEEAIPEFFDNRKIVMDTIIEYLQANNVSDLFSSVMKYLKEQSYHSDWVENRFLYKIFRCYIFNKSKEQILGGLLAYYDHPSGITPQHRPAYQYVQYIFGFFFLLLIIWSFRYQFTEGYLSKYDEHTDQLMP
ncbi:hypothetical protein RF11_05999 [Thelohanellus kitauei]|uniref:Uncharacterized protein n=1 Tax=Thelohanellus kitauei TaxID=669202 RepID=A0A0C2NCB0_THEKT|nr:hypothetical protein RF11_05999 [Thelohanellus kitauei]